MKEFSQTYVIEAPVEKVFQALTDASVAEDWGAAPASVNAIEGGEFSYWDGDIHGIYTKIIPNQLIEQDWYGHDNPDRKFKAVFEFQEHEGETEVKLNFSGEIEDEAKDIKDWQEYYFDPIKVLLEQ